MTLTKQSKGRGAYLKQWRLKNLEREKERQRVWQRKWRIENPERARELDSIKHKNRKEQERQYQKNYQRKVDPIKLAARTILNNAIKLGKIKKATKCEKCDNVKVQAHHSDYNLPLKVNWLCSKHHALEHYPYKP